MTLNFTRAAIALAIALGLAGCGGTASFPISGTIVGLSYNGLVLSTNGMELAVPAPPDPSTSTSTSFAFPNSLSYGDVYNVVVKTQPAHQTCTVGSFVTPKGVVLNSGSDTAGRLSTINIGVQCVLNSNTIGGTVKGLTSDGLVLINGSFGEQVAVAKPAAGVGDTTFTLPTPVPFGTSYGVTVYGQPDKDICTVTANGAGVMGDTPVPDPKAVTDTSGVVVTCSPKPVPAT